MRKPKRSKTQTQPDTFQIELHPNLTEIQRDILKDDAQFYILTGVAGAAKSYTALAKGLTALKNGKVERILIIRSSVSSRSIGFLPGTSTEKMSVFEAPYIALLENLVPTKSWAEWNTKKLISLEPTSFLRGQTWDNTFVIADEIQNLNKSEIHTIVTRVGKNTHLMLVGDPYQTDLRGQEIEEHKATLKIVESMDEVSVYDFEVEDIVRSGFVRSYFIRLAEVHGYGH